MSVSSQMSKTGHGVEKQFEKETEKEATKDYCWGKKETIYTVILRFTSKVLHPPDIT